MGNRETALQALIALCHRRWGLSILAALAGCDGARFVELQQQLGASAQPLREGLDALLAVGHLEPVPGYGHPLRPEYRLAPRRAALAAAATALTAAPAGARAQFARKWSLPLLAVLASGEQRYAEIATRLPEASPRALALALRGLEGAGLIARHVGKERPPAVRYGLTAAGRRLLPALEALLSALKALPPVD